MPRYKQYPNESPMAARRRIAKNRAQDRGMPQQGQMIQDQMANQSVYTTQEIQSNLTWNDPNEKIPPDAGRRRKMQGVNRPRPKI